MASLLGQAAGAFLALGGIAYIWLGILWALRIQKRWPRLSYWSAAALEALLGIATAQSTGEHVLYGLVTVAACAFVITREHKALIRRNAQPVAA